MNSHFEDWSVNSRVAGQVKSGGGMTFVAVEAAGHMVPMDQPQVVGRQQDAHHNYQSNVETLWASGSKPQFEQRLLDL